jgi:hypothetical protein
MLYLKEYLCCFELLKNPFIGIGIYFKPIWSPIAISALISQWMKGVNMSKMV